MNRTESIALLRQAAAGLIAVLIMLAAVFLIPLAFAGGEWPRALAFFAMGISGLWLLQFSRPSGLSSAGAPPSNEELKTTASDAMAKPSTTSLLLLALGAVLAPVIGGAVIYYSLRKSHPRTADSANILSFVAFVGWMAVDWTPKIRISSGFSISPLGMSVSLIGLGIALLAVRRIRRARAA